MKRSRLKGDKLKKECLKCGSGFLTGRINRDYCSEECRKAAQSERLNKYRKLDRQINIELNRCAECGTDLIDERFKLCLRCRERYKRYYSNRVK